MSWKIFVFIKLNSNSRIYNITWNIYIYIELLSYKESWFYMVNNLRTAGNGEFESATDSLSLSLSLSLSKSIMKFYPISCRKNPSHPRCYHHFYYSFLRGDLRGGSRSHSGTGDTSDIDPPPSVSISPNYPTVYLHLCSLCTSACACCARVREGTAPTTGASSERKCDRGRDGISLFRSYPFRVSPSKWSPCSFLLGLAERQRDAGEIRGEDARRKRRRPRKDVICRQPAATRRWKMLESFVKAIRNGGITRERERRNRFKGRDREKETRHFSSSSLSSFEMNATILGRRKKLYIYIYIYFFIKRNGIIRGTW